MEAISSILRAFVALSAGGLLAQAQRVNPNQNSLLKTKKVLIIAGSESNPSNAHFGSRDILAARLNQLKTQVGFQATVITGSGNPLTSISGGLDQFDIIVFNYWFHSYVSQQPAFKPFADAFKAWTLNTTRKRGWVGVHTGGANEANEWNWFRDSVTSMRYSLHGEATPAGTIRCTNDQAVRTHPIMEGLPDTMRVPADEWYYFTYGPTWSDVRVMYNVDEKTLSTKPAPENAMDPHPMAWFREDPKTKNRFFYTALIHQNPGATSAFNVFFGNMILRALEYVAGESTVSIVVNNRNIGVSTGPDIVRNGELAMYSAEPYTLAVYSPQGKLLFHTRGNGSQTFRPEALKKSGIYALQVASRSGNFSQKVLVP
jgi:hypothetical protein